MGLVALALALIEVEVTFTAETDCEICVGLQ
jgi:hypothetical protein